MAASFVVDASVLIEFLAQGRYGEAADRLLGALAWATPIELQAPDLVVLETANALRKLVMRKEISAAAAEVAIADLKGLAIVTVPSAALLEVAWSFRKRFTIYDASYLALAGVLDIPLVTTDARLARGARGAGIRAWTVDHPELSRMLDDLEAAGR